MSLPMYIAEHQKGNNKGDRITDNGLTAGVYTSGRGECAPYLYTSRPSDRLVEQDEKKKREIPKRGSMTCLLLHPLLTSSAAAAPVKSPSLELIDTSTVESTVRDWGKEKKRYRLSHTRHPIRAAAADGDEYARWAGDEPQRTIFELFFFLSFSWINPSSIMQTPDVTLHVMRWLLAVSRFVWFTAIQRTTRPLTNV